MPSPSSSPDSVADMLFIAGLSSLVCLVLGWGDAIPMVIGGVGLYTVGVSSNFSPSDVASGARPPVFVMVLGPISWLSAVVCAGLLLLNR